METLEEIIEAGRANRESKCEVDLDYYQNLLESL